MEVRWTEGTKALEHSRAQLRAVKAQRGEVEALLNLVTQIRRENHFAEKMKEALSIGNG